MQGVKQVFLMGTGRSGTTIVNRLLGLHKSIWSFRHESQVFSGLPPLVDFIDTKFNEGKFNSFEKKVLNHLYKRGSAETYFAGLYEIIDKESLNDLLNQLRESLSKSDDRGDKVSACTKFSDRIFSDAAILSGKSTWIEKTPRNLVYADMIKQLYPNARFINVVRDGRLVAKSIQNKGFWPVARSFRFDETKSLGGEINEISAIRYWVNLMKVTDMMRMRVGSENWMDVRLEDLSEDLGLFQKRVEGFLDVPHDESFLEKAAGMFDKGAANRSLKDGFEVGADTELSALLAHYLKVYGYKSL